MNTVLNTLCLLHTPRDFQPYLKETMILLQVSIQLFKCFLKWFPFCTSCKRISWSKPLTRVCVRRLGWLFPEGTSGWRLGFTATVCHQSQQRVSASPKFALVGKGPRNVPSKCGTARHGQSRQRQGVFWDELLCSLTAAAAEPALPSCLMGQELAAPFTLFFFQTCLQTSFSFRKC